MAIIWSLIALALFKSLQSGGGVATMDKKRAFILAAWDSATQAALKAGWTRDIILNVAALESGWGLSGLTAKANNLFGFKSSPMWERAGGRTITLPTREVYENIEDWRKDSANVSLASVIGKKNYGGKEFYEVMVNTKFRAYDSWLDSMNDYTRLIGAYAHYADANAAARRGDLQGYWTAIHLSPYATDKEYDQKLAKVYDDIKTASV